MRTRLTNRRLAVAALPLAMAAATAAIAATASERRCYFVETETLTAGARLTVSEHDEVSGTLDATVHDEANGYFTSYSQEVLGELRGADAALRITTWIEYDVQDTEETWRLGPDALITAQATMEARSCDAVDARLAEIGFADAFTVEGDAGYPWHFRRVAFDPGFATATYRSGVVRGERDIYLLRARAGQVVTLWIDAVEDNAVVDLLGPQGETLVREAREARVEIPDHGEYRIVVGGTRGNAGYELVIALR